MSSDVAPSFVLTLQPVCVVNVVGPGLVRIAGPLDEVDLTFVLRHLLDLVERRAEDPRPASRRWRARAAVAAAAGGEKRECADEGGEGRRAQVPPSHLRHSLPPFPPVLR